ncbi:FAST kinase domain-containing protein 1, mitochondrial isoform X3 [Prionailurus viverrinus]|uniref:FAST kinase domain-containing protein 1, mitochondrial isoform X3 n=1 Tax=Prionailurus bengalensis TaxID=37029 RepID=UPI001CA92336|nr:FAST kinase domain-containing protein 1, mitochondrial isoform X3 [Prionailurus bengalensis]XP_047726720.1 FAST kinase domain-containing protein 1, mitochondrial isoform X3 [Prionailurus viverrinus]
MLRLRAVCPFSWRAFQFRSCSCKPLITEMVKCTNEGQIFDLIQKSKAILSEKQVECAFNILWQFQKQKTSFLKNVECVRDHPQFITLHNLATSQTEFMNDDTLVNVLYLTQQCATETHDLLVEALVTEAWRRLESFVKLFVALGPMAGPEEKEQLKSTILLMSEELTSQQALAVMGAMEEMESRNSHLNKKIASILHKHLDNYKPIELLKITRALIFLHFQNKELFVKLRELLHSYLKISVIPSEISILVYALSILPSPYLDEVEVSRIEAVLPQCDLTDLNSFATSVLRWIHYDRTYLDNTTGKQLKLLQKLDHYGLQRLQKCTNLNLLWEELKSLKGDWFAESLLEETVATLHRLMDEINYKNVAEIASFLSRTNYLSTLLLDRIASVVLQQTEKIHPFAILPIILPFSILNYDPPQSDEFFGICVQHLNSYLSVLDPLMLVFLGFSLATLEYFPEDLLQAIFNIKFLAKMDSQLELLCSSLSMRVQLRLMELNRAVCLECPEYQIPWFHDRFCQQQYNKDTGSMNGAQQQIYKMLAEVLGGTNYVKASVLTPYYHKIDFECILDKRKKPLPYGSNNITLGKLPEMHWESNTQITGSTLPPGAERIALEFLDSRAFCRNIPHLKGKSAMKKRHLEILGYRVIQIPHFEWNSMALSTKEARMDYLRECIFGEGKS